MPVFDFLYPEDLLPVLVSGITGERPGMPGEILAVLVFLDTPILGYLLTVILSIRRFRRGNKNGGSREKRA
jgi:hypothetical protein